MDLDRIETEDFRHKDEFIWPMKSLAQQQVILDHSAVG
jgi:hypothetical protein